MVKVLLVPIAIVGFILFLLAIGAFGLLVSMAVISLLGQIWRGISGGGRLVGRGGRRLRRSGGDRSSNDGAGSGGRRRFSRRGRRRRS